MTTNNARTQRVTVLLAVAALACSHLFFEILPGVFETLNLQTVDQLFLFRSANASLRPPYDSTVIHVDITDNSIIRLTGSYLRRTHYAQVARNLADMEAAVQIWDYIIRAPGDEEDDRAMTESLREAGNVYFGVAFDLADEKPDRRPPRPESHWALLDATAWKTVVLEGDPGEMFVATNPIVTYPGLAEATRGLGYLSVRYDRDGVFRRVPLLIRYDDHFYPAFAFRAVCDYLGVTPDRVVVRPGRSVTLVGARRPGGDAHDIVIPVDERCNLLVNYAGDWQRMMHVDFADMHDISDDRDMMENEGVEHFGGKFIVVSEVSTGASDVGPVPTDNNFPLSGLHANVAHTILTENFLTAVDGWTMFLVEILLMAAVLLLAFRFSSQGLWAGSLGLLAGYVAAAAALFLYGNTIVNIIRPSMALVLGVFAIIAHRYINEEKEKEALRRSFESYLPPSVVKRIMANPSSMFAGQKRELTVLFSDIKSFTTYSSVMSPDQIQKMLNEYFEAMVEVVFKHGGTVDKYIGDGLMVFFGAPEVQEDHALRCVRAAIDMQKRCRELKSTWAWKDQFPLKIRVGINTGPVVVGNMGSARKLSYTVLGSDVNLANRLESNAPVEGILISHRTFELVQGRIPTRDHEPIMVKGLDTPIVVHEVVVES